MTEWEYYIERLTGADAETAAELKALGDGQ